MFDDERVEWFYVGVKSEVFVRGGALGVRGMVRGLRARGWRTGEAPAVVVAVPPDQLVARQLGGRGVAILSGLIELFASCEHFPERILTNDGFSVDRVEDCFALGIGFGPVPRGCAQDRVAEAAEGGGGNGHGAVSDVFDDMNLALGHRGGGLCHTHTEVRGRLRPDRCRALRGAEGQVDVSEAGDNVDDAVGDCVILPADDHRLVLGIQVAGPRQTLAEFLLQRLRGEDDILRLDHSCFQIHALRSVECLYFPRH